MERVVTINLNGNPYPLEEPAYDALRAYLERARATLADNPDKAEIIRDLEQAIADKCAAHLSPSKTVVTASEMTHVLEEMGPVEGEHDQAPRDNATPGAAPRKRLYRIKEGAVMSGVCAGIGAYFDIDPNFIRLLVILLTLVTSGGFLLVYVAMMFLIPSAHTSEEWAAAHGVPFNAQEVIDRAKREYQHFTANGPPWTWSRWQRRAWKREMRARWRDWRWRGGWYGTGAAPFAASAAAPAGPVSYGGRVAGGLIAFCAGLVRAVLAVIFVVFLFSLVTTNAIGNWRVPANWETWQAVVLLVVAYVVIVAPFRAMSWAAWGGGYWGYRGGSGLVSIVFIALAAWFAWTYIPEAHAWMAQIPDYLIRFGEGLRDTISNFAAPVIR
jgi:phage shock protein PspC (stress-responsive transcriptional regulator)